MLSALQDDCLDGCVQPESGLKLCVCLYVAFSMYQSHVKGRVVHGTAKTVVAVDREEDDDETGDGPDSGTDMSVFSDFQSAWSKKFPGCELPKAWEEDVRGNLSKHRQKVTLLKEDLEKEEFYVEYLERLLADVERCVRKPSLISGSPDRSTSPSINANERDTTPSKGTSGDQYVTVISVASYGEIQRNASKSLHSRDETEDQGSLIENPLYQDEDNDKNGVCWIYVYCSRITILLTLSVPCLYALRSLFAMRFNFKTYAKCLV